jgi:hypothetical protein
MRDQIGHVILKLADVIDIAAPLRRRSMAAKVRRDHPSLKPLGQGHTQPGHPARTPARAVQRDDHDSRASGGPQAK